MIMGDKGGKKRQKKKQETNQRQAGSKTKGQAGKAAKRSTDIDFAEVTAGLGPSNTFGKRCCAHRSLIYIYGNRRLGWLADWNS
jgi:hypothetical protein